MDRELEVNLESWIYLECHLLVLLCVWFISNLLGQTWVLNDDESAEGKTASQIT